MFDWAFAGFGDTYTWDLTASEPVRVADLGGPAWAADFDRDGQLFVTSWEFPVMAPKPTLKTLDPSNGFYTDVGLYTIEGEQLEDGQAPPLTVWGEAGAPGYRSGGCAAVRSRGRLAAARGQRVRGGPAHPAALGRVAPRYGSRGCCGRAGSSPRSFKVPGLSNS